MGAQTPKSTAAETVNDVKIETHRQQDRNLFCKKSVRISYSTILNNNYCKDDILHGRTFTVQNS